MDSLKQDLGYATRTLRKNPGFAITAMLTIALGIGATTAIFSVVNAVLLRPLPYANAERLVLVWGDMRNRGVTDFPFPPGDYPDLKEQGTLFEDFAAVVTARQPLTGDDGEPEQIRGAGATTNIFRLLGARVMLGRDFVEADAAPQENPVQQGAPPAAQQQPPPAPLPGMTILSHEFWQRRYGGDPSIVGKSITIGGNRSEVIGVLEPGVELLFPPGTNIERRPDAWTAMRLDFAGGSRINVFLRVIGRLEPGVTVAQAQAQMDRLAADLRERFPIKNTAGLHIRVEPMQQDLVQDVRPAILALMGAVTFVLLIACANVANLLLVRASRRERELAVRSALGASGSRLVRQMLAESLLIAAGGAALGLFLAWAGIRLLSAIAPATLPRIDGVTIDPVVLGFTALAALLAAAAFGVIPAVRASRPDVMQILRSSGRTGALGAGALLRNSVVTAEVALSFILLIGCGLMLRSFIALQNSNPGFDPDNVLTFTANARGEEAEQRRVFMSQMRERLTALPGVEAVTAANPLPLGDGVANARWGKEDALSDPGKFQQADVHIVLPGYFEAMRTRIIAGRDFTADDNRDSVNRVIVDRLVAAKAFPGESPIGKRLLVRVRTQEPEWYEVIGVVDHQRNVTLAEDSREAMFFADGYFFHGAANRWVVRTSADPSRVAGAVRAEVQRIDALVPVAELQPMSAFVDRAMAPTRFALVLITVFGVIAAALAAIGLYGVLSTAVRQRTAEIGVRMVFGAQKSSIFRLVIGHGLKLTAAGVAVGLLGAFMVTRVMRGMLVGVAPTDPLTFAAMAALFLAIAAVACFLPARRAAGLDPTAALREE
jgi:putative ABC transport system permease protein